MQHPQPDSNATRPARRLTFRTITVVEGPEIDAWLARQAALDHADDVRAQVRWRAAYLLLGGTLPAQEVRP